MKAEHLIERRLGALSGGELQRVLLALALNPLPDLLLLDDMMPGFSGVDTLKQIKKDGIYNHKIVVLTANATSGEKERYLGLGFDYYLAKPMDKEELNKVLNMYL